MKRRSLITIVITLAIIVLALIIFALFFHAKSAPVSSLSTNPFSDAVETGTANSVASPATFSINFYKWYIGNFESSIGFPSTQQLATLFPQWATSNFILTYQSEKGDLNFDEDPVLYSQDVPDGWRSGLTAKILTQTTTTSSVQVVIGSGSVTQTYIVQLVKNNGQWFIDSISSPN